MERKWNRKIYFVFVCLLSLNVCALATLQLKDRQSIIFGQSSKLPRTAQGSESSISCDVKNGETYDRGELNAITWNVSGYVNHLYALKDNGIAFEFGTILSNSSDMISQEIGSVEGWHAFSIHIYSAGVLIDESYVVVEIFAPVDFWGKYLPWIIASVAIASSTTANLLLYRRKVKPLDRSSELRTFGRNASEQRGDSIDKGSVSLHNVQSDLLFTSNAIEADDWDFISTTRVEKIWTCRLPFTTFSMSNLLRPDLVDPARSLTLDERLSNYFQEITGSQIQETRGGLFINMVGLQDIERLLIVTDGSKLAMGFLLNGRITKNYLDRILESFKEVEPVLNDSENLTTNIATILETNLHLSRSRIYVEPPAQITRILSAQNILREDQDQDLWREARLLTPSECDQILQKMKKTREGSSPNPFFDETEVLTGDNIKP